MAGTLKYISQQEDNQSIAVTVEYATNDAAAITWQEVESFPRERFTSFSSASQFHTEVMLPGAAIKIKARRALRIARDAAATAITAATVYTVPDT